MRDEALFLAEEVDDILSRYVAVHDAVFKPSFRKVVPLPGVFEAIDFDSHCQTLSGLYSDLTKAINSMAEGRSLAEASSHESKFLAVLEDYSRALVEATQRLSIICLQLRRSSQGDPNYSYPEFHEDVRQYEASTERYKALGDHLNWLLRRLEHHP